MTNTGKTRMKTLSFYYSQLLSVKLLISKGFDQYSKSLSAVQSKIANMNRKIIQELEETSCTIMYLKKAVLPVMTLASIKIHVYL